MKIRSTTCANLATISTLHKLIHKWLTLSVQGSCNSLDAFKPGLKISLFSLTLVAVRRRISQFLWRSIIFVFICTKLIWYVLVFCTSSTILSEISDAVNLARLKICWTPLNLLRFIKICLFRLCHGSCSNRYCIENFIDYYIANWPRKTFKRSKSFDFGATIYLLSIYQINT